MNLAISKSETMDFGELTEICLTGMRPPTAPSDFRRVPCLAKYDVREKKLLKAAATPNTASPLTTPAAKIYLGGT